MENGTTQVLLAEAAAYFRSRPGLTRMLIGFVDKYRSLGRLGGAIFLQDLRQEEKAALEAFFRKPLTTQPLRISAAMFKRALADTRFNTLDPEAVLAAWQGVRLISKQQERKNREQARRKKLAEIMQEFSQSICQSWLKAAIDRAPGTHRVQIALRRDVQFADHMRVVLRALENLPLDYCRLPVFARNISGDPHGLDIDSEAGKLFLDGLRYVRREKQKPVAEDGEDERISSIEEVSELLYEFRILRDDLMNFAACIGLTAYDGNGEIGYWRAAAEAGAPLNVPLREIARVDRFCSAVADKLPFSLPDSEPEFHVFVVENSGIFSALLDENSSGYCAWRASPLVCLHGQLKLASWALLDRLVRSGAMLHYSGDFDPEGLQIAEKILQRYSGRARIWRMSAADYFAAGPSIPLESSRLHKLGGITHEELLPLAQALTQTRQAAYQEGILQTLVADIQDSAMGK